MVAEATILDRVFHLLAGFPSPEQVLALKSTPTEHERLSYLTDLNHKNQLSQSEYDELQQFMLAEQYVRLAKAKALLALNTAKDE